MDLDLRPVTILAADDPPPVIERNADASPPLLIIADHAGRRVPQALGSLGLPEVELARHIGDVAVGELVAVVAHDPAAAVDVPAWCRMKAQELAGTDTADDGAPRYVVRRVS